MDSQQIMEKAKAFVAVNVSACAQDLLTWKGTGILPEGKLREAGDILKEFHSEAFLSIAEDLTVKAALQLVVSSAWRPIEDAPKDGSLFMVWDGQEQMLGTWVHDNRKSLGAPDGFLDLATPKMPLGSYSDMPRPIAFHPLLPNP